MKYFTILPILFLLISLLGLPGCQAVTSENDPSIESSPESLLQDGEADNEIIIEGQVVPAEVYTLAFAGTGLVAEVLVREGDQVAQGQELARLEGQDQAEATVKTTELELLAAQQALQALTDAEDNNQNLAYLALVEARQAVDDAESHLEAITGDRLQNEIAGAKAQIVIAENKLENARDAFEEYEEEPEEDTTRASFQVRLTEAQQLYDEAVLQLDNLDGAGYEFLLQQAQDRLAGAREQLRLAEEHYGKTTEGPDPAEVQITQSRIAAAEASLAAAKASRDNLVLRAPAAGTLVKIQVRAGELLALGQPFGILADLSEWYVETVDLTEIDVVNIRVGQLGQVSADALPGVQMEAVVESISDIFQDARGDITYVARLRLEDGDPHLRWGMTVLVAFSPPE